MYVGRGNLEKGIEYLNMAIKHDPDYAGAHVSLAVTHTQAEHFRQAEHHLRSLDFL